MATACLLWFSTSLVMLSWSCYVPPVEERLHFSDIFVYGRVRHNQKTALTGDTYIIEMDLYCVFKGGPLPKVINITLPASVTDRCLDYKITGGNRYLLYLDATDGINRLTFDPEHVTQTDQLDYVPFMCDVNIQYPIGVTVTSAVEKCPEPYDYPEHCVQFQEVYPVAGHGDRKYADLAGHGDLATTIARSETTRERQLPDARTTHAAIDLETHNNEIESTSLSSSLHSGSVFSSLLVSGILPFIME